MRPEVVKRSNDRRDFHVCPAAGWLEATFGWLTHCRWLCRDEERSTARADDFIKIAMIRLTLVRLAGQPTPYRNIGPQGPDTNRYCSVT
jgi:hypothetical protein